MMSTCACSHSSIVLLIVGLKPCDFLNYLRGIVRSMVDKNLATMSNLALTKFINNNELNQV